MYNANSSSSRRRGDNVSPMTAEYEAEFVLSDEQHDLDDVNGSKSAHYADSMQLRENVSANSNNDEPDEELDEREEEIHAELNKNIDFYVALLSSIKEPMVCDLEAKSSLIRLSPIELDTFLGKNEESETSSSVSPKTGDTLEATENADISSANSSGTDVNTNTTTTTATTTVAKTTATGEYIPSYEVISKMLENLNYTLELSSEANTFNKVYTGDANEITLKDLDPNTEYFLR